MYGITGRYSGLAGVKVDRVGSMAAPPRAPCLRRAVRTDLFLRHRWSRVVPRGLPRWVAYTPVAGLPPLVSMTASLRVAYTRRARNLLRLGHLGRRDNGSASEGSSLMNRRLVVPRATPGEFPVTFLRGMQKWSKTRHGQPT